MMRDPGENSALRLPPRRTAAQRRSGFVLLIVFFLVGALLAVIALGVFLTQGSQIQVRARVLSERCHTQYDVATHQDETRCDATVQFTTRSGQLVTTTITDAFPYEFSGTGQTRTVGLRYDSADPTQPYKQSNYMPVGTFVTLLVIGSVSMLVAGWALRNLRRLRRRPAF